MSEKLYRFAGLELSLSAPEEMLYETELWLEPFVTDRVEDPHRYTLHRSETLPVPEGDCVSLSANGRIYENSGKWMRYLGAEGGDPEKAVLCSVHEGKNHAVFLSGRIYRGDLKVSTVLDGLDINHLILRNRSVILHASFIEWEGKAVLFTAPCQTGKSTQAQLWKDLRRAEIINGDRGVIRISQDQILAEGLPFCGSSGHSRNRSLPLTAIVLLDQAPVTTIRRLQGYEAFAAVWSGLTMDRGNRADLDLASQTVETIVGRIPVYHMPCTPDEEAVNVLEQELRKQGEL